MSNATGPSGAPGAHREILRATSISGVAAIVSIGVSVVRMKAIAMIVGPAGIGLMGMLQRVLTLAAAISTLGVGQSGGRHIAAASADEVALAHMRRAVFVVSMVLGTLGLAVVWLFREPIAVAALGDARHASDVGWLGLGVWLNAVTASQTGLLQGLRRIGDLARVSILSSILGGVLGVGLIWQLGIDGVVWTMLATPFIGMLVAWRFTARLPRPAPNVRTRWVELAPRWRALLTTGVAVFVGGLVATLVQLEARKVVVGELGFVETGKFEAAWQISMLYIGFVLSAMGTDYLPRLTAIVQDQAARRRLVNEQTEVALMLAAPVFVALAGLAPVVVRVLYTNDFDSTVDLLRLHVIGDIARLLAWPLAYALLAFGANRLYVIGESVWSVVYLVLVWLTVSGEGLIGTAWAYVAACVAYLGWLVFATHRFMQVAFERKVLQHVGVVAAVCGGLIAVGFTHEAIGIALGAVATLITAWVSLRAIARTVGRESRLGRLLARVGLGARQGG